VHFLGQTQKQTHQSVEHIVTPSEQTKQTIDTALNDFQHSQTLSQQTQQPLKQLCAVIPILLKIGIC